MRTRIFNKMTAREVEDYLARGGDTMFAPVGVVECHSAMPVDVEQIVPEAYALLMAERAGWTGYGQSPVFLPRRNRCQQFHGTGYGSAEH